MSLNTIVEETSPEIGPDLDGVRSAFGEYPWILGPGLLVVGLLSASYVLDALGGKIGEQPGMVHVVAGLLGAYAVLVAGLTVAAGLVWGGFTLVQSVRESESENPS